MINLFDRCSKFLNDPRLAARPYAVQSKVSDESFKDFLAALKGSEPIAEKPSFDELMQLCEEFGFSDFANRLSIMKQKARCKRLGLFEMTLAG